MKPACCRKRYYLLRLMRPEKGLILVPTVDLRLLLEILPKPSSLGLETVPRREEEFHL
jgi:hypothetical protein